MEEPQKTPAAVEEVLDEPAVTQTREIEHMPRMKEEATKEPTAKNDQKIKGELHEKASDAPKTKNKKGWVIAAVAVLALLVIVLSVGVIKSSPSMKYKSAQDLLAKGNYSEAGKKLESIGSYEDASTLAMYCKACALCESGDYQIGVAALTALGNYKDCEMRIIYYTARYYEDISGTDDWEGMLEAQSLYRTVPVFLDSAERILALDTRIAALWNEIAVRDAASAGGLRTVGLKSDGTVVAVGNNYLGQCDVGTWTDIVAVSAGGYHTVGLKSDGTVVAVGYNDFGQCDVGTWTDIVAVSAGGSRTFGLKTDGTVVAVGDNDDGQCDVGAWTDIVAVSAGGSHTVGLKTDGTVVAVGDNKYGQCDVETLTDIVAVSAGERHTVGLKTDSTVVAVGYNKYGQCDVGAWQLKQVERPQRR